jgi:hypothetical protein
LPLLSAALPLLLVCLFLFFICLDVDWSPSKQLISCSECLVLTSANITPVLHSSLLLIFSSPCVVIVLGARVSRVSCPVSWTPAAEEEQKYKKLEQRQTNHNNCRRN